MSLKQQLKNAAKNWSDAVADAGDAVKPDDGTYTFNITGADIYADGALKVIVPFVVADGEMEGRVHKEWYNVTERGWSFARFLNAIGYDAAEFDLETDLEDFVKGLGDEGLQVEGVLTTKGDWQNLRILSLIDDEGDDDEGDDEGDWEVGDTVMAEYEDEGEFEVTITSVTDDGYMVADEEGNEWEVEEVSACDDEEEEEEEEEDVEDEEEDEEEEEDDAEDEEEDAEEGFEEGEEVLAMIRGAETEARFVRYEDDDESCVVKVGRKHHTVSLDDVSGFDDEEE